MESVHSTVFSKLFQRIYAFIFWLLLLARVDAQQTNDASILAYWAHELEAYINGPIDNGYFNPRAYFSTWNFGDENPCAWMGVQCTANFTVEELDFSDWRLPVFSLSIFSGLKDLRYLDLSNNFIPSTLLSEDIGNFTGLTHLDLSCSGLSGTISANISRCISLRYLSLEQNQLISEIPSLGGLVNLQVLRLADNNLTGPLPKDLSELTFLASIDVSDNNLNGTIPSLSNFPNLVELKLDNNFFSAFEPLSFGNNSLQRLFVSENQLGGMIPPNITNLLNLQVLNMSGNRFVGSIPSGFSGLWNLSLISVDLSRNNLSGNIPVDLIQPCSAGFECTHKRSVMINMSYNLLSGDLPLNSSQFAPGSVVDLSHNQLSGPVPLIFNHIEDSVGIFSLWLQNNQLSGDLVDLLVQAASNVTGKISLNLYSELHLENNHFTGDLSRMIGKWDDLGIPIVGLSNNYLQLTTSEIIPDPLGATLQNFADYLGNGSIQLHLAGNNFSGASLPTTCFGRRKIGNYFEVLDLSNNLLHGEILGEVFNATCLPQLQSLNLSNNRIHGHVPESIILPDLVILDLSSNNLSGHLPFIQTSSPLYDPRIFANNTGLCGDPLSSCPTDNTQTGVQWWLVLIIVMVSVMGFVGSCIIATWRWRVYLARHQQDADLIKTLLEREAATLMPLRELKKATDNFAESSQIGEGGFGTVYVGNLNDGTMVAIKRSKREVREDKKQFLNEVRILSQVNHRFLVKLLGCCMEDKIALLVFEFIPNGTLQDHLHGKVGNATLTWKQRLNVAVQTADALSYLHSATTFPIYHRDVKSANILLDEDFNAKVADFGISKLAPIRSTHVSTVGVQGTMGYIDPEYYTSFQLTDRSDVYSFGVVLLELISAKPAIDFLRGGAETSLVYFIRPHIEKGDLEPVIDPTLMKTYLGPAGCGRGSILNVGRLAMNCLDMRSKTRPRMNEVWKQLQDLWLEFSGKPEHLISVNQGSGEAPQCDPKFSVQSDTGSIQMSQFSLKLGEQGFNVEAQLQYNGKERVEDVEVDTSRP